MYTTMKAIEYPRTILDMIHHNRKSVRAYDNITMMSQASRLNIAIKNGKQPKHSND